MEIIQVNQLYEEILFKMADNANEGLKFFKETWVKLDFETKEILKYFLSKHITTLLLQNNLIVEIQMYWVSMLNVLNQDETDLHPAWKLDRTDKLKAIQVAHLFYNLQTHGYITNTLDELSDIVSGLFDFNPATIFSYLNEPERFSKVKPLFQ